MSRRQKASALIIAVIAMLGGGTTWAATSSDNGTALQPDGSTASGGPTTAVIEVQSDIQANFALFRNQPPSRMPADIAAQVGSSQAFGRNPSLARAIKTVTGTGWVIPGNGYLCIAMPDPVDGFGMSCMPTADAIREGLGISIWGNLPNGNAADTILVADGHGAINGGDAAPLDDGVASAFTDAPGTLRPVP